VSTTHLNGCGLCERLTTQSTQRGFQSFEIYSAGGNDPLKGGSRPNLMFAGTATTTLPANGGNDALVCEAGAYRWMAVRQRCGSMAERQRRRCCRRHFSSLMAGASDIVLMTPNINRQARDDGGDLGPRDADLAIQTSGETPSIGWRRPIIFVGTLPVR